MSKHIDNGLNKQHVYYVAGILLITVICFIPSLFNDWVNWDDPTYVISNPLVVSDKIEWSAIFTKDQLLGIYHPITILSYAVDYQVWELNPFGYHLTNTLFHLCNTSLVFAVFRKLKTSLLTACVVALSFGIHPMHIESVAWISERKDVLYVFFLLFAWMSYLSFSDSKTRKKWFWYFVMLVLFSASILSKPIAFVFPIILILSDFLNKRSFRKVFWEKVPVFIMAGIAIFIAQWGQVESGSIGMEDPHPVSTLFYGGYNLVFYSLKVFLPFQLSIFHPFPLDDSMNMILYISTIPAIGFLYLLYWSFRKSRKIFFGLLFFLLTIAPLLQIIPFGKALSSERYTYLPYLGLFYIVGIGIETIIQHGSTWKKMLFFGFTTWGIMLFGLSIKQQSVWKNSETLWTSVIKNYPDGYWGYLARGRYHNENQEASLAIIDFNKSIQLFPSAEALYERGGIQEANGNLDAALSDYLSSINSSQSYARSHNNASGVYARKGNKSRAFFHVRKAIQLEADYSLAHCNYAILLKSEGDGEQALISIQKAIALEPKNLFYIEMRAAIYTDLGFRKNAITDFLEVVKNKPNNGVAHYYLGLNYDLERELKQAKKHLKLAITLNYPVPEKIQKQYSL